MKQPFRNILIFLCALIVTVSGPFSVTAFAARDSELAPIIDTLYSVTADKTSVGIGGTVTFTVTTSQDTTRVKVEDSAGTVLAQATTGYQNVSARREWKLSATLSQLGTNNLTVYTGVPYGYCSFRKISITVTNVTAPVVSNVSVKNLTLNCSVSGCSSISQACVVIRRSDGTTVYGDYQGEKLSTAGNYQVLAYLRSDATKTLSAPVAFSITADQVSAYKLLSNAISIITVNEGNYSSVVANDNGACSIGILGWHATRAHDLLNRIKSADDALTQTMLSGTTIYGELSKSNTTWRSRILSSSEVTALKNLLATSISKRVQDEMAEDDVGGYMAHGRNRGIANSGALLYYCDLYNQSPGRAIDITNAVKNAGKAFTLDNMHTYALANPVMGQYTYRRNLTYNTIIKMGYTV